MSISLSTLNILLDSYISNITLVNQILTLGANDYIGGLGSAIEYLATDSIDVLKGSVSANAGLTLATTKNNTGLVNYYKGTATNHLTAILIAAQNQNTTIFDLLLPYVSDVDTLFLCYVYMQNSTEVTNILSSNPTNLNTGLLIACNYCDETIVDILITAGANNFIDCIEAIKLIANNTSAEYILSALLAAL
jgi:ankyrin repeat protein